MPYANRLQRRRLRGRDTAVSEDKQNAYEDNALSTTIKFGLAALFGYKLWQGGVLKDIAKPLLELGDKVAREGTDKASVAMHTIRDWSLMEHLDSAQLQAIGGRKYNPPKNSFFRKRDSSIFYDLFQDTKDSLSGSHIANFTRLRQILQDTQADLRQLTQMMDENFADMPNRRQNFYDTEMYRQIKEVQEFERAIQFHSTEQSIAFNRKAAEEFMSVRTLTSEKAAEQLQRTGYRSLVLGDILEVVQDSYGAPTLAPKPGAPIDLTKLRNGHWDTVMHTISVFLNDSTHWVHDAQGNFVDPFMSGMWKNLILDSHIAVGETGNVIDYRMSTNALNNFITSLSRDFGLPVVKFNPLRTIFGMTGLDERFAYHPLIGALSSSQIDPSITGVGGRVTLGEWMKDTFGDTFARKSVAIINGTAYTTNSDNSDVIKLAENLNLRNITDTKFSIHVNPRIDAMRQMAGLTFGEPLNVPVDDYAAQFKAQTGRDLSQTERWRYQIAQFFDLGFKEWRPAGTEYPRNLESSSNIDVWTDNLIDKITRKIRVNGFEYDDVNAMLEGAHSAAGDLDYSSVFGEGFSKVYYGSGSYQFHKYITTRRGITLGDIYKNLQRDDVDQVIETTKGYFAQFFSGRLPDGTMGKYWTERTGHTWGILNTLNDQLGESAYFLGFSNDSKRNVVEYAEQFLIRRALPVYMALQVPGMINYLSEPFFPQKDKDGTSNMGNISKALMSNVVKPVDITAHHAMDLVGATDFFKFLQEYIPGTDNITELPIIHQLGIGQTAEERKEYIENGFDPVRKGRFWGVGNTPFTGTKIMYWRPNIYRRVEADVKFSDSKWGSRQEYYENAWFPNIANPLAPLNHYILSPNYFDYKHYYDRPYMQTAPEGQNIPIIGPMFGPTIGQLMRPARKMHPEYWYGQGPVVNPLDELPDTLVSEGIRYERPSRYLHRGTPDFHVLSMRQKMIGQANQQREIQERDEKIAKNRIRREKQQGYFGTLNRTAYQAKQVTSRTVRDSSGILFSERTVYPSAPSWTGDAKSPFAVYSTPSGAMTIVDVPETRTLWDVNKDLRSGSINRIVGAKNKVTISDMNGPDIPVGNDSAKVDNSFMYDLGEQYDTLSDVAGLKGFVLEQFITGHPNQNKRVIENSGYAYSTNSAFWGQNLGGLGGNLSEITRRFIQKRNTNVEYVNPIRNTMPSWAPGSDYFTDFKHGDPYSKIEVGEERLPGEGYERLYHMGNKMDLRIGSSSIGYEKPYIIKHMLNADPVDSDFEEDTLSKGNQIHKHIESLWKQAGIAFSTEGEIKDNRNGILGYYDAMVYDMSSPTGIGIVDIKSTSAKKLEEIRKSGKPLPHHQRQVNYYLWATENMDSRGYIYYVDKENLNNSFTVGFNYDDDMLRDTLKNVNEARNEIRSAIKHGIIGRGELYSELDRYRILADVAPYSQEFKDAKAILARKDLSEEEHKEYQQINERLKQQKEPLRVYPYKFKTANLQHHMVTVKDIIDNNHILVSTGQGDEVVKFAGLTVTESSDPVFRKKYPRKQRKGLEKAIHGLRKEIEKPPSKAEVARREIRKYITPGKRIEIAYDVDESNKHSGDSFNSIRAVLYKGRVNVNQALITSGWAKPKEDDSPAGIHVQYTGGQIAFGAAMERLTHDVVGNIPFVASKLYPVKSPYEDYRDKEVYGKSFQSWNHFIRDMFVPNMIDRPIGNQALGGILPIVTTAYFGSLFGRNNFGRVVGGFIGGAIPTLGKVIYALNTNQDREWRPKRRRDQEEINEYVDILKYIKNIRLYNQYAQKSLTEDHFDVDKFISSKEYFGMVSKRRADELKDYKKRVKIDFKHSKSYPFKFDRPKYVTPKMNREETIKGINREINELESNRRVQQIPLNAMKAIEFRNEAQKTMYAYEPGDPLTSIMSALPKKERQYFKYFMDAPEEEKPKILRIAPSYLRRALQASWGMKVDDKPSLLEYFRTHGLPDSNWIGWDENVSMDDVKVKIVHQSKQDPGEFDIWQDTRTHANAVNIPIPKIHHSSSPAQTQVRLQQVLGEIGMQNVQANVIGGSFRNRTTLVVDRDVRNDVENQIENMDV